jgi:hypothetical protein
MCRSVRITNQHEARKILHPYIRIARDLIYTIYKTIMVKQKGKDAETKSLDLFEREENRHPIGTLRNDLDLETHE